MFHEEDIPLLKGYTFTKVDTDKSEYINFFRSDGAVLKMYHEYQCCENVWLDDICGDLQDLVGEEILQASICSSNDPKHQNGMGDDDMWREWTFYKIATIKGHVTLRWCGETAQNYSLEVTLRRIK